MSTKISDTFNSSDLPKSGRQADQLLRIIETAKNITLFDSEVESNSLLEALRKGRVVKVYLNTGSDETFGIGEYVLHMGRFESANFLSFLNEIYSLHRASSSDSDAEGARTQV